MGPATAAAPECLLADIVQRAEQDRGEADEEGGVPDGGDGRQAVQRR